MSQYDETPRPAPANHVKVAHLVFGSFFLGIAALWALTESGNLSWHGSSYLLPVTLVIAGAIGLAANLVGNGVNRVRRRPTTQLDEEPAGTMEEPIERDETDQTKEIR